MKSFLLADRYARGLDALVPGPAEAETWSAALTEMARTFTESPDFQQQLSNPAIRESARLALLDTIYRRAGTPDILRQLAATMLRRGRINLLPAVARLFAIKTDVRLNRVTAHVTTATPLAEDQGARLQHTLQTYTGKSVRIEYSIDPALLGGVTARIQDRILDGSVRSRIKRLKQFLLPEERSGA